MTLKEDFLKEVDNLSNKARKAIEKLIEIHTESNIANQMRGDDQTQFNLVLGEHIKSFHINFNIYLVNINAYMLDLVCYFPQEDYHYPVGVTPDLAEFTLTAAPLLGYMTYSTPISALSIDEAIEVALEYVHENMNDIIRECMGHSTI